MIRAFGTTTLAIVAILLFSGVPYDAARSHSGGTNAAGCHTNSKTGDFHCHTPKVVPSNTVVYCHVVGGESHCGYALSTCNNLVSTFGGSCVRQ